jgi:hypothetical protein
MLGLFNIFNIPEEKGIVGLVQRERKPKEAVLFGILIHLKGLSTRDVSNLFMVCGVRISHVACGCMGVGTEIWKQCKRDIVLQKWITTQCNCS